MGPTNKIGHDSARSRRELGGASRVGARQFGTRRGGWRRGGTRCGTRGAKATFHFDLRNEEHNRGARLFERTNLTNIT